jgi:hypothetical protein
MKGEPELPSDSANASGDPEPQAQHPAETSPNGNPKVYRAKGKIASLTKEQRDTLNRLLLNGATYAMVIRRMAEQGISLNHQNVSNWHRGPGYQLWLKNQEWIQEMQAEHECGLDVMPDFDAAKFNEAALEVAVTQLFRAFRLLGSGQLKTQLGGDPQGFARLVNALARACRETVHLKKYREAATAAGSPPGQPSPPEPEAGLTPENLRKIEKKLKLR